MLRSNYAMTPAEKADARAALKILDGTTITLEEAARRAVKGQRALRRVTMMQAVDEFVLTRIKAGKRHATSDWYDQRLRPVADVLGEKIFDTIARAELKDTLESLLPTEPARAATARACRALWRWGMRVEPAVAGADMTIGLDFRGRRPVPATPVPRAPKVLTIGQCQAIIDGMPAEYLDAISLMLFAGIRPEEVAGPHKEWMRWEFVSKEDKIIRVPEEISKTRKTRVIEGLPPTLWRLLRPGDLTANICPHSANAAIKWAQKLGGFKTRRKKEGVAWPQDALRHTFATYALAFTQDPGQVSLWLGHEGKPELLHTTYRGERSADGVVTIAVAKKFFALRRRSLALAD